MPGKIKRKVAVLAAGATLATGALVAGPALLAPHSASAEAYSTYNCYSRTVYSTYGTAMRYLTCYRDYTWSEEVFTGKVDGWYRVQTAPLQGSWYYIGR